MIIFTFDFSNEVHLRKLNTKQTLTLQDKMFPNAEKVSYKALLSMLLSKFLMKTFPTPDLRREGSR
jgi:hypothetical protein